MAFPNLIFPHCNDYFGCELWLRLASIKVLLTWEKFLFNVFPNVFVVLPTLDLLFNNHFQELPQCLTSIIFTNHIYCFFCSASKFFDSDVTFTLEFNNIFLFLMFNLLEGLLLTGQCAVRYVHYITNCEKQWDNTMMKFLETSLLELILTQSKILLVRNFSRISMHKEARIS